MTEHRSPAKKQVKIQDLANLGRQVDISDTEFIMVRGLNLKEMITLFIDYGQVFLPLYAAGLEGSELGSLAPFLVSAPDLVARIIAIASDNLEGADMVETRMAATVQLIALAEIWKASVPDPKKAQELLSEVMALLQKLPKDSNDNAKELPKSASPTTSLVESTS